MTMEKVYKFLEKINSFEGLYNISTSIRELVKDKKPTKNEQNYIDVECAVFDIINQMGCNRKDWMDKAYTIIDEHLDYLVSRINATDNVLLKAVYSEILFYSKNTKYKKYINIAADSYLSLIKGYHEKLSEHFDNSYELCNLIDKTIHLTKSANKRTEGIKNEIKAILNTCISKDASFVPLIRCIIETMLDNKKIFNKNDFDKIDDIYWQSIKKKIKEKDYQYVINTIDLGLRIDERRGKLSYPWREEKCKCYEYIIKNQTNPVLACSFCIEAIESIKSLDYTSKHIHNIEKQYMSLKNKIILPSHDMKVDITHFIEYADTILEYEPLQILDYLSNSKYLFPQKEVLEKPHGFLTNYFPATYLDHNSHPSKIGNNEVINDLYLSNYRSVWFLCEKTIQRIIIKGIKSKKLNLQILILYLMDNSCLFDIQEKKFNEKKVKYNWSSNLIRIFETYFQEMETSIKNPKIYYPHLVEITESLVLRFETLLRLILEAYEEPSITSKVKEKGIIREQDINALLYNEFLMKLLSFEDILYFRYLFVAHQGYNLRNDIAHGLLIPGQYTVELFNLVFFAFLRLAKYNIPNKKTNKLKKEYYNFNYKNFKYEDFLCKTIKFSKNNRK